MGKRRRLTCVNISFINNHCSPSHPPQKLTSPLLPLRQLPVIFNSSIVWMFWTWNFADGPLGDLDAQR